MELKQAELDTLVMWAAESSGRVDLDQFVRQAAIVLLDREASARAYAPGARYVVGERVWYQGQVTEVLAVHPRGNPAQGSFVVLELRTPDGAMARAVAEAGSAPRVAESPENSGGVLAAFLDAHTAELRAIVERDSRLAPLVSVPAGHIALTAPVVYPVAAPARPSTLFRGDALNAYSGVAQLAGHVSMAARPEAAVALDDAGLRAKYAAVRTALDGAIRGFTEGQTWTCCIAPAIAALGWAYAPLPDGGGFALFPDATSRDHALFLARQGKPMLKSAFALLLVEGWERPLGRQATPDVSASPALRLAGRLLSDGIPWGILTNGREWRLYSSAWGDPDVGSTLGVFHSVDLFDIFGLPGDISGPTDVQLRRFRAWFAVFGPGASVPDVRGRSTIDGLKRESSAYAREIVRALRQRLLESVLPEIAGGFIAYRTVEQGVGTETDETLEDITLASLGLVYRLLYVLYAEQHGILPMDNPEYRGQSLTTLARWAGECVADGPLPSLSTRVTPRYEELLALFHHLDHGNPLLGLAETGGGLFSSVNPEASFLERHRLSDRVVARVLFALTTVGGEPVDYAVISVRHLSAVAEGLIESLLWVVEPAAGQVVLVSNRGEPQAPSSVPVPDFVGVSVIKKAITTALDARAARFVSAMDRIAILRRGPVDTLSAKVALAAAERAACDALLGIKVLDPAMGTGTFLVAAIDALVDGIAAALVTYHRSHPWVPWGWNPLTRMLAETREAILATAQVQGVVVQPDNLEDEVILSRLVAERAIYGVDLSQTAVSLGSASVAMRAFAVGAPFIDVARHIRRGDSLVGVRLVEVRDEPAVARLVAGLLASSSSMPGGDEAAPDTTSFEALLDLWVSEDLGNKGARDLLSRLGNDTLLTLQGVRPLGPADTAVIRSARKLGEALGFLHWDVAFPEVFLEQSGADEGQLGFDVIIGSPPATSPGSVPGDGGDSPFRARAHQLVRRPGGRVAFVVTPSSES